MSDDLCLGLLIGVISGAAWACLFFTSPARKRRKLRKKILDTDRQIKRSKDELSMLRHLQDLEMDIQRGRLP